MAGPKLTVGNVEIIALLDTPMIFDFSMFFPKVESKQWEPWKQQYPAAFTDEGRFRTTASCYLLR